METDAEGEDEGKMPELNMWISKTDLFKTFARINSRLVAVCADYAKQIEQEDGLQGSALRSAVSMRMAHNQEKVIEPILQETGLDLEGYRAAIHEFEDDEDFQELHR